MDEQTLHHYMFVRRLAGAKGDETNPTEDLIDLAQAVLHLFERLDHLENINA